MEKRLLAEVLLWKLSQVEERCGVKKSFIYQEMKEGRFPLSVKLSSKSVAWRSDEVIEWVNSRPRSQQMGVTR
jgi:prophage regulatory protein